jgi:hypothetical protein
VPVTQASSNHHIHPLKENSDAMPASRFLD